jgi:uncharacterized protein YcbX
MPPSIRVVSLHCYPVKACRGIELQHAVLGPRGFDGDREWMIVDASGRFLTQRTHPQLARVQTALSERQLVLSVAGQGSVAVPRHVTPGRESARQVRVWNDDVEAQSCGPEAAAWLSRFLSVPVELVQATAATRREPAERWRGDIAAPVNFPDGFPLLVCSVSSLADLNSRLEAPVPMTRFRPNLVIEGLPAYAEDGLRDLAIGPVQLRLAKACTRCAVTVVDQQSGEQGTNPLRALREYRFDKELLGVTFGQNALIVAGQGAAIEPGAEVAVA